MEVYQILDNWEVVTHPVLKKGRKYLYVKVGYEEKRFEEYYPNVWREKRERGTPMVVYETREKVREVLLDEQLKCELQQLTECIGLRTGVIIDVTDKTGLKMCINAIQATLAKVSNNG